MSQLRDWNELTDEEIDLITDRLLPDVMQQPPLVRTGQGDYAQDWTPEPRAAVGKGTAIFVGVMLVALGVLGALVIASLP